MDSGTKSLLNMFGSVLAPVLVLDYCSVAGERVWQLGTTPAMGIALSLPLLCGLWTFCEKRTVDPITLFGLLGTILTGIVTVYANTGDGGAIRPDTPWWYAAKEALIALLLGGAVLVTARRKDSLLRLFVYSEALFDIPAIEQRVAADNRQSEYENVLWRAGLYTALSLILSALANFGLSLYFLLPVLDQPAEQQTLAYNYAVSNMTWWGYLVIGIPLLGTLFGVMRYLTRALCRLTGMDSSRVMMR